jgi:hypothetical protein
MPVVCGAAAGKLGHADIEARTEELGNALRSEADKKAAERLPCGLRRKMNT